MLKDDLVRIRHMLDAAKEAKSFIKGKKRSDLDTDRMLVLSLVKSIEIMGEAASFSSDLVYIIIKRLGDKTQERAQSYNH